MYEVLTLNKANGDSINIDVTVAPATYDFDMIFYGLRVNGVVCTDPTLLMQYKEDPETAWGWPCQPAYPQDPPAKWHPY